MNKQIVANGQLVSYSELGSGNAEAVIFLHGWRSGKEVWARVLSYLSISNCQLISMDLPGFGGSEMPKKNFTIGDYAETLADFITKLELKNVTLVGHSFGGRVAIKLAAKNPKLISKLILVDSAGFVMEGSRKNLMVATAKLVKPIFKPWFMQGLRKKIYQSIGAEDYLATPELQKTFMNVVNEDLTEDMKKVDCPTLVIFGEKDTDTPVEFGKRMHSIIHNSKFLILKNAGHFSFIDQPEEFIKILNTFINS